MNIIHKFPPKDSTVNRPPTPAEILACRPAMVTSLEPELAAPIPRPAVWKYQDGSCHARTVLFQSAVACRSWVVRIDVDSSDPEGPDYDVWHAFDLNGIQLHHHRFAFDTVHWRIGCPQYYQWFHSVMKVGSGLTVLIAEEHEEIPEGLTGRPIIYAALEPYVTLSFRDLVHGWRVPSLDTDRSAVLGQILEILWQVEASDPSLLLEALYLTGLRCQAGTTARQRALRDFCHQARQGNGVEAALLAMCSIVGDHGTVLWAPE